MLPERRPSLDEVASGLGLHPLDLARMLGHRGELPADLRISAGDPARIAAWAGVEHWWEGVVLPAEDPARSRAAVEHGRLRGARGPARAPCARAGDCGVRIKGLSQSGHAFRLFKQAG